MAKAPAATVPHAEPAKSNFVRSYMRKILNSDPEHWRRRAAESRKIADQLDDPDAKATMLEIAQAYDQLALLIETKRTPHEK